jgi:hypothetical protein
MQATLVVQGESRGGAIAAGQLAGTAEENEPRPTIGPLRAAAVVAAILALLFALGYVTTRSKRRINDRG